MKVDLSSELGRIATTAPAREAGKAEKAARDFESVLLTSLFDSLQKAFTWDREDSTPWASNYRLMANRAMADAVAANGGFGIGKFILSHLPITKVPGAS
jgi:Rod binding domain-containing protein